MVFRTLLTTLWFFSGLTYAESRTIISSPEIKGDGCRPDSVGVALSPDQGALSILFDKFIAEAGGTQREQRKNCHIVVPLELDKDETLSVLSVDYRGYTFLPQGASSSLEVENWFGDKEGQEVVKKFKGQRDEEYLFTDTIKMDKKHWAPCGRSLRLHIQTAIRVKTNDKNEQALVSVDTLDLSQGITYKLEKRKCRREHDERWDNPHRKREADRKEREREKDREERFKKKKSSPDHDHDHDHDDDDDDD